MTSSVFLDINVWLALTLRTHEHHDSAWAWYGSLPQSVDLVFCRFTQLGLLRLLTNRAVTAEATMSQRQAWAAYDKWIAHGGAVFREEPFGIEVEFRSISDREASSPKEWADSYLAAFASSSSAELVTFDRGLSLRAGNATLLG